MGSSVDTIRITYTVVKRLGEVDYLISTPDRREAKWIVHVNLLRTFLTRPSVFQVSPVALVGSSVSVQDSCTVPVGESGPLTTGATWAVDDTSGPLPANL